MSAVTQRVKRKTAGQRMTALVGKAQEEDDTFWGHDTWAEGEDSGNESFRDSDEDSALKKDEFDSDFDDSESDHEDEERAAGEEEEKELQRQEKSTGKGGKGYVEVGRQIKGKAKRVVGDGMNAGIVLNFPASLGGAAPLPTPAAVPLAPSAAGSISTAASTKTPPKKTGKRITMASTRTKRSVTSNKRLRESTLEASAKPPPESTRRTPSSNKKSGKRTFTQEEMLLEAVHVTEPENKRWLLARKRIQDIEDKDKESMSLRDKNKGPVIQQYHSKRGCLKTLSFPVMDHVPEILTRRKVVLEKPKEVLCVITGKPARYKDPKTNLGYFDLAAFKELRRRLEANERLDQREKAPSPKTKPAEESSGAQPEEKAEPMEIDEPEAKAEPKAKTPPKAKAESKAKTPPKPLTGPSAANPAPDVTPSTPKPTTNPSVAGGPGVPALSPSGRRISPRSRKPSEKVLSNPQLANLVKRGSSGSLSGSPSKPTLAIPDSSTTPKSNGSAAVPEPSPSNANGSTSATPQTASKQNSTTTASVGAKVKHKTTPTKSKSTAAAKTKPVGTEKEAKATATVAEPSDDKAKADETVYVVSNESKPAARGPEVLTQSQLIMQVIEDYNKKHPEVQE